MKNINKILTKFLSITCALTVVISGGIKASAETVNLTFSKYVSIPNQDYGNVSCTNIGGIALNSNGDAKELYVLKSHKDETKSVLYYYPNIANKSNYVIIKLNNIAGHANSMTIGSSNIFITRWQSGGNIKNDIVRIKRSAIRTIYNNTSNGQIASTVLGTNSDSVTIIKVYKGTTEANISNANQEYDIRIAAITKYGTDIDQYNNGKYFIVGRSQNSTTKTFAKAKLRTNANGKPELVVLTEEKFTTNDTLDSYTGQDFHYYPGKGFFVSYWLNETPVYNQNVDNGNGGNLKYGVKNRILHYRFFNHDTLFNSSHLEIRNIYNINGNSSTYLKFEIESLTFNGNKLMVSVNAQKWSSNTTGSTIAQKAKNDALTGASDDQIIQTEAL